MREGGGALESERGEVLYSMGCSWTLLTFALGRWVVHPGMFTMLLETLKPYFWIGLVVMVLVV